MEKALRLRAAVVNAVSHGEHDRLLGLLRQISSLSPSASLLRETGLGFLVADASCWALGGHIALALSIKITRSWKEKVKDQKGAGPSKQGSAARPFGQFQKASTFCTAMNKIEQDLSAAFGQAFDHAVYKRAAIDSALQGFTSLATFVGCTASDVELISRNPAAKALLVQAVDMAHAVQVKKKRRLIRALSGPEVPALAVPSIERLAILDRPAQATDVDDLPLGRLPGAASSSTSASASTSLAAPGTLMAYSSIATSMCSSSASELAGV